MSRVAGQPATKVRCIFFASLRETLGVDTLDLTVQGGITIQALVDQLATKQGKHWAETLNEEAVNVAVNHHIVGRDTVVAPGDEVAFLPPVTGG